MEKEDKHLGGDGLGRVWAKIKAQYLAKTGGTLTGKLTISSGGLEVTGDSRYHDNVVLDNTKGLVFKNTSNGNVTALSLNSQNVLVIGYGNASVNQTQIFGKSIILATNGANTRMTIGEDGDISMNNNLAVSGAISEGGTLISTKYTYTEGSYVSITDNAISVKEASSSQGGVVTTGEQTLKGVKTFSNTGEQQVILKYNGSGNSHIGLGFANADGLKSEIYVNANNNEAPYYLAAGGTAYEMYHAGNVNISTKSWVCNNLTFYGTLKPNGNNTQDIGGQNNVVNYLYVNYIVTPGGNGIRFGVNNGDFRFYGSRLSFTDTYKLFTIKKAGGVRVHKGSLEVENGNIMASGGVAAGGIADLTIY